MGTEFKDGIKTFHAKSRKDWRDWLEEYLESEMAAAGQKLIDRAIVTGTWTALEAVQKSVIPEDLQKELNKDRKALKNFQQFPPSSKRIILEWILNARRPETRVKRIQETVKLAAKNIKANHYRQ
jgi:uncharacterized protein YdeI (YjbR/CyaY-like superfamily)